VGLLRHRRRGAIRVVGVEPGQSDRGDLVAAAAEVGRDGIPGPRPEPVAGDENDRRWGVCDGVHTPMLRWGQDDGMSLFWSPFLG